MKKHQALSPMQQRDRYDELRRDFNTYAGGPAADAILGFAYGAWERLHNNDPSESVQYFVMGGVAAAGTATLLGLSAWANRKYRQSHGAVMAEWGPAPVSSFSVIAMLNGDAVEAEGREVGIIEQPPLA